MSSDRANEAHPLMDKPQPTAPVDPGFLPPPYSSVIGTHSQAYTPIPHSTQPPYPTETTSAQAPYPMPMQMPMPQVHAPYPMHDGKGMSMPMPLPVYAPTTYDPMSSVPTVSPNQTVIVARSPGNGRSQRCRCMQIFAVIGIILVVLGVGLRMMKNSQRRKQAERFKYQQEEDQRRQQEREREELRRFNEAVRNSPWPPPNYNDRYKRMVHDEQPDSKDYGFLNIDDHPSFVKSFKPEKSNRKRRSTEEKKESFRKHKKARSYQKKGSKKGKYYHR